MQHKQQEPTNDLATTPPLQHKKEINATPDFAQIQQDRQGAIQAKHRPVQRMQGYQPHQAKHQPVQRMKGYQPHQAKHRPVQRHTSGARDLKTDMGTQYGVDLSGFKEHQNSVFPAKVGALATIQGKDIHYAPGQYTEQNRKHELGHAIDNTLNGVPKGDTTVQGYNIDTTREKAADKIAETPVQRQVDVQETLGASSVENNSEIVQRTIKKCLTHGEALSLAANQWHHLTTVNESIGSKLGHSLLGMLGQNKARTAFENAVLAKSKDEEVYNVEDFPWSQMYHTALSDADYNTEGKDYYKAGESTQGTVYTSGINAAWGQITSSVKNQSGNQWGPATGPVGQWTLIGQVALKVVDRIMQQGEWDFYRHKSSKEDRENHWDIEIGFHSKLSADLFGIIWDGLKDSFIMAIGSGYGEGNDGDGVKAPIHHLIGRHVQDLMNYVGGAGYKFTTGGIFEFVIRSLEEIVGYGLKAKSVNTKETVAINRGGDDIV